MSKGHCKDCGAKVEYNNDGYSSPQCESCWNRSKNKSKEKEMEMGKESGMNITERNEKFKKRLEEETANPHWNCRFHPTDYWHEWGCPHKEWSTDELQRALILAKASSVVNAEFSITEHSSLPKESDAIKFGEWLHSKKATAMVTPGWYLYVRGGRKSFLTEEAYELFKAEKEEKK